MKAFLITLLAAIALALVSFAAPVEHGSTNSRTARRCSRTRPDRSRPIRGRPYPAPSAQNVRESDRLDAGPVRMTAPSDADRLADQVFSRLDRDGDGCLSVEEMSRALDDLGLSQPQRHHQCARMMPAGGASLDRDAFRAFCRQRLGPMQDLFRKISTARTDFISYDDLHQALDRVGLEADRPKILRLIAMVDKDGDNLITFDEFYTAFILLPSSSVSDLFHSWDRASLSHTSSMHPQQEAAQAPGFTSSALIAGGVAGIVSRTVTAPFDRLKLILQADGSPRVSLGNSLRRIYREGGVRGLFRGNFANVIKVCPENAIKMWAFNHLGGFSLDQSRSVSEQLAVGAAAGAISQTFIYPLETIKTHFALSRAGQYRSLVACAVSIYERRGVMGFYQGLTAATIGMVPYAGVDLSLFAFFKRTWEERYPDHHPSALQLLGFGAISSTSGQLVAYPFQLIRTRLQSQGMPNRPIIYSGIRDCFWQTIDQDGYRGLYRGLTPNFIKSLPSISISYVIYDIMYRYLQT